MIQNSHRQDEVSQKLSSTFPAARFSFLYVNRPVKPQIAGLYRLLNIIEQCLYRASDSQISKAKLAWWMDELHSARIGAGTHPLSLQLISCGALDAWPESLLTRLFTLAMHRVDAAGLNTETDLLSMCEAIGTIHLELECALASQAVPNHSMITQLMTVNGQMQLMRESFWAKRASFYWVPLTLCAQFSLQRQHIAEDDVKQQGTQWVPAIARLVLGNLDASGPTRAAMGELPMAWQRASLHWLIFSLLQQRQLVRMEKELSRPGSTGNVGSLLSQVNFLDFWASWRLARLVIGGKQK